MGAMRFAVVAEGLSFHNLRWDETCYQQAAKLDDAALYRATQVAGMSYHVLVLFRALYAAALSGEGLL